MGKAITIPFVFNTIRTNENTYTVVYRLVSGVGPETIELSPIDRSLENSTPITSGFKSNGEILKANTDYRLTVRCKGAKGADKLYSNYNGITGTGGKGGFVQGTFTLRKGDSIYISTDRWGAVFRGKRESWFYTIMIGGQGGGEGQSCDGGDAGIFASNGSNHPAGNSGGGSGGRTFGWTSGSGGGGGFGGGEPHGRVSGGSGKNFSGGAGAVGGDGVGGDGGRGYYGGGGGGSGFDYGSQYGGQFGGGGGGGSSYLGGIPANKGYGEAIILTDTSHGTHDDIDSSVEIVSANLYVDDVSEVNLNQELEYDISTDTVYRLEYVSIQSSAGGIVSYRPDLEETTSSVSILKNTLNSSDTINIAQVGNQIQIDDGAIIFEPDISPEFTGEHPGIIFENNGLSFNVP